MWMKIAARLGMSPSEAMSKHTVSQFRKWQVFFEQELNEFHREDYGFARVAYEVYQLRAALAAFFKVELPQRSVKDFITTFEIAKRAEEEDVDSQEKMEEFVAASQAKWFGALGLDSSGKPRPNPYEVGEGEEPAEAAPGMAPPPVIKPQTGQTPGGVRTRRVFKVNKGS